MTDQHSRLVQIVLPTFNGSRHIAEALSSLLGQSHSEITVLVMDNASTDGTSEIVAEIARQDRRVTHCRADNFLCATANWVRGLDGIDLSGGSYFMWASDDDIWDRDCVGKLLGELESDPHAVLAFPQSRRIDDVGTLGVHLCPESFPQKGGFEQTLALINSGRYTAIYGVMRASALRWRPVLADVSFGSDLWFLMQLSAQGRFRFLNETLFYKRTGGISEDHSDASASNDPALVWNLSADERRLIMGLPFYTIQKSFLYRRLQVSAKMLHPTKDFGLLVSLWAALRMLRSNPRALGIRRRINAMARRDA